MKNRIQRKQRSSRTPSRMPRIHGRLRKGCKRILVIGEAVSLAHIGRPAVLARWAREAGYEVYFACGNKRHFLGNQEAIEGQKVLDLKTITPSVFYERLSKGCFFYTQDEMESYIADERRLIKEIEPDLVVSDFRLTLETSTQLEGVSLLALSQGHWNPMDVCPIPAPSSPPFTWMPKKAAEAVFNVIRPIAFRTFARGLDQVRCRHGLEPHNDFRKHYTAGSACAYLDHPLMNDGASLPSNHFFLGPVVWSPKIKVDLPGCVGRSRPVIYLTCGSTGDSHWVGGILEQMVTAGFEVVVTGLNSSLAHIPDVNRFQKSKRVFMYELIDPVRVLKKASLTICHGGSGTVYQSLAQGVPVCCLPTNPDQWLVSWAAERAKVARVLEYERNKIEHTGRTIIHMAKDKNLRQRAKRMAESIKEWDTRGKWISYLNSMIPMQTSNPLRLIEKDNVVYEKI